MGQIKAYLLKVTEAVMPPAPQTGATAPAGTQPAATQPAAAAPTGTQPAATQPGTATPAGAQPTGAPAATTPEPQSTVEMTDCSGTFVPTWKDDIFNGESVGSIDCGSPYQFNLVRDVNSIKMQNGTESLPVDLTDLTADKFVLIEPYTPQGGQSEQIKVQIFATKEELDVYRDQKVKELESKYGRLEGGEPTVKDTGVDLRLETSLLINPLFNRTPAVRDPFSGLTLTDAGVGKMSTSVGFSISADTNLLALAWEGLQVLRFGIEGGGLWDTGISKHYCNGSETACDSSVGYLGGTFGLEISKTIIENWMGKEKSEDAWDWDLAGYAKFLVGYQWTNAKAALNTTATPTKYESSGLVIPGQDYLEAGLRMTLKMPVGFNLAFTAAYFRFPHIINEQ